MHLTEPPPFSRNSETSTEIGAVILDPAAVPISVRWFTPYRNHADSAELGVLYLFAVSRYARQNAQHFEQQARTQ